MGEFVYYLEVESEDIAVFHPTFSSLFLFNQKMCVESEMSGANESVAKSPYLLPGRKLEQERVANILLYALMTLKCNMHLFNWKNNVNH